MPERLGDRDVSRTDGIGIIDGQGLRDDASARKAPRQILGMDLGPVEPDRVGLE